MNQIGRADKLIEMLEAAGYEAYYVGGCVRDLFCGKSGRPPESDATADIDVTTSATPDEMKEVFADLRYFETGIKHGTITVLMPDEERRPIEITTFRTDGEYTDNRHPDAVRFVRNLKEDLARRDFTINAMAMDRHGNVADLYGGMQDIEAGVIRAIGDPDRRFQEDALRILRALRFAAELEHCSGSEEAEANAAVAEVNVENQSHEGAVTKIDTCCEPNGSFVIEPETEAAMFRNQELLRNISTERIYAELKKLVVGPYAGIVIRRYVDIIGVFIPELLPMKGFEQHNPYHKYDVLEHCIRAMEAVRPAHVARTMQSDASDNADDVSAGNEDNSGNEGKSGKSSKRGYAKDYQLKLAALLHDVGKPQTFFLDEDGIGHMYGHAAAGEEIVRNIMNRLKADNEAKDRICTLVKHHDLVFQNDKRLLKKWMNRYTPEILLEILHIKRADNYATGNMSEELAVKFDEIEATIHEILDEQQCFCLKDLAIGGRDIIEIGRRRSDCRRENSNGADGESKGKSKSKSTEHLPGPLIGETLQALLDEVIDGSLPNEKEALAARAEELLKQQSAI